MADQDFTQYAARRFNADRHLDWGRIVGLSLVALIAFLLTNAGGLAAPVVPSPDVSATLVGSAPPGVVRLPFNGGPYIVTQGPQNSQCNSDVSHYKGAGPLNERALDIAIKELPVLAAGGGQITGITGSPTAVGGYMITIDHGGGVRTYYAHLTANSWGTLRVGSSVTAGQQIAISGNTGNVPFHLHFAATNDGISADIRGLPGLRWFDVLESGNADSNPPIQWTSDGYVFNCTRRVGRNDGTATGIAPPAESDPRLEAEVGIGGNLVEGGQAILTIAVRNYGNGPTPAMSPYVEGYDGNGGQFWRSFGPDPASAVIGAGEMRTFTVKVDLFRPGLWVATDIYLWNNSAGQYWKPLPANGRNNRFSFNVAPPPCLPAPIITSGVSVTPPNAMVGDVVTATFTLRNDGCATFNASILDLAIRGPGGLNEDMALDNISIPAGQSYTYTNTRVFDSAGTRTYWVDYFDGTWHGNTMPETSGASSEGSFTIVPCAPRPVVTSSLTASPGSPLMHEPTAFTFTVTNTGCADFRPVALGPTVRPAGDVNEDPEWAWGVGIPAGQSYTYRGSRTFTSAGDRYMQVLYRDDSGGSPAFPQIPAASGVARDGTLTVRPGMTLALSSTVGGNAAAAPVAAAYAPGTVVSLSATASAGYAFSGWTIDGASGGAANPLALTLHANRMVVANFARLPDPTPTPSPSASPSPSPRSSPVPSPSPTPSPSPAPPPSASPSPSPSPLPTPPPNPAPVATLTVAPAIGGSASVSPPGPYTVGQRVTLTAVPDAGQLFLGWQLGGASATGIGTAPAVVGWASPFSLTLGANTTIAPVFAPRPSYPDIAAGDPAAAAIAQLAARGVIKGYAWGDFGPADNTLRAQMAALIVRAMGWGGETPANPFADRNGVDDELWQAIATLAAHDVARGYGDGTYGTTDNVLNAQVVSFITRAMVAQGRWRYQPDSGAAYPNVPGDSGHRVDFATYVHYVGALPDFPDTGADFGPWDQPSTREWFARTLWQALDSYYGR